MSDEPMIGNNVNGPVEVNEKSIFDRWSNYVGEIDSTEFTSLFNHLQGQMLTIADAMFTDKTQREAAKSIIKRTIWDNYEELQRWLFRQMQDKNSPKGTGRAPANVFPF